MQSKPERRPAPATRAAQALRHIDPTTGAVVPGIELASTYARDADYAPRQSYIYARDGGPTVVALEALVADLDGAEDALAFASGMAALSALAEILRPGDHVAAPKVIYHGAANLLRRIAQNRGVALTFFDPSEPGALEASLRPGETRLLWIEAATNPTWQVIDIAAAARAAHAAGALLGADCTVAPPCTTRALALGADIVFHSASKYLGGHSDLTAGVLCAARRDALWDEIRAARTLLGATLGGFEAWLLMRGVRTLFLRYARASQNALEIATALAAHPGVAAVLYPGLPSHPGHEIARRQMTGGFGGMLSILVRGDGATARDVARFTEIFVPATSLGGVESLIEHRRAVEGDHPTSPETLLRLSIGIEDAGDLIDDLTRALERAGCNG